MDTQQTKTCSRCRQTKSLPDFNKKIRSKDGYRPECRACQHEDNEIAKPVRQTRDQKNKARISLYQAQYHKEHREAILARHVRNRLKNPAKHLAYMAAYRAAHPDYFREAAKRRRAQVAGAQITDLSQAQFEEILQQSSYRCCYCPADCKACRRKTHVFQKEHLTPISKGGNHTVHNVLPACAHCNAKKHAGNVLKPVQPFLLTVAPFHVKKRRHTPHFIV